MIHMEKKKLKNFQIYGSYIKLITSHAYKIIEQYQYTSSN